MNDKKVLRFINGALAAVLCVSAILFLFITAPSAFGIQSYTIKTPSMLPEMPEGSFAYVDTNVSPDSIETGEVILYSSGVNDVDVMHRVISNDSQKQIFETKGDANSASDKEVTYEQFIGKRVFFTPVFGEVAARIVDNKVSIMIVLSILMASLFILSLLLEHHIKTIKNEAGEECLGIASENQ